MSPGITLLLVDALNLIRRVFAAQPGEGAEKVESARTSSAQSLARALRQCEPSHAVCVFDGAGPSWRHELFAGYKAGHAPMPAELAAGLDGFREEFRRRGVVSLGRPGIEADDVIATLARKTAAAGGLAIVLSTDKVFLELLPHGVRVRDHFRGAELDAGWARRKFGVEPERLADLLALAGDRGNGIPGVTGVGPKTAARLLACFETLERVLESAADIEGKLGERLRAEADTARLCHRLVALRTDLDLGINLRDLRIRSDGANTHDPRALR